LESVNDRQFRGLGADIGRVSFPIKDPPRRGGKGRIDGAGARGDKGVIRRARIYRGLRGARVELTIQAGVGGKKQERNRQ